MYSEFCSETSSGSKVLGSEPRLKRSSAAWATPGEQESSRIAAHVIASPFHAGTPKGDVRVAVRKTEGLCMAALAGTGRQERFRRHGLGRNPMVYDHDAGMPGWLHSFSRLRLHSFSRLRLHSLRRLSLPLVGI